MPAKTRVLCGMEVPTRVPLQSMSRCVGAAGVMMRGRPMSAEAEQLQEKHANKERSAQHRTD